MYPPATKPGFKIGKLVGAIALVAILALAAYLLIRPRETPLDRAQALIRAGKAAAAVPILEELQRKQPDNPSLFPWLAQAYLNCERLGEGRTALDTALRLKLPARTLVPVVLSYAEYYERKGDFKEAENLFRSAENACSPEALAEGKATLYQRWAEAEAAAQHIDVAIVQLEKVRELCQHISEPLKTRCMHLLSEYYRQLAAVAELKKKNDSEAVVLLEKSLAVSDEPATRMAMAAIYWRQGRAEKALEHYGVVSHADPNNLEARHRLIDLLVEKKDFARAQEALVELTDKERSVENYQLLASLNLKLGNRAGAVRALEEATALRPKDPILLSQLEKSLLDWSAELARQGKQQESMSVKGHADRVAEMVAMLGHKEDEKKPFDEKTATEGESSPQLSAPAEPPPWNPAVPPIALSSSRIWLAKGSLTPEGEITIRNITGRPVTDLSLTVVFFDKTTRTSNGAITMPVATPTSAPFAPNSTRSLYFSCPTIVKADHQLAVIIYWKGRLLRELPCIKQR